MFRRSFSARVLAGLSIAALSMSACGSSSSGAALSVDGRAVSVAYLKAELASFVSNKKFMAKVGGPTAVGTVNNYKNTFVANVLTNELYNSVITLEAEKRGLKPAAGTADLRAEVETSVGGKDVLDAFPSEFQNQLVNRRLMAEALLQSYKKDQDPKKYFTANQAKFATACISHILVKDEATAATARQRVSGGEDFAKVAKELSTDPGSKDAGGVLPCGPVSQYVPPFAAAASVLKVGELSQPVKTDFGFHIIKVTKRDAPAYDGAAKAQAEAATATLANTALNTDLANRLKKAKIIVNPAYGTLVAQSATNGLPEIVAKESKPKAQLVKPGSDPSTTAP